jgi:endonuclease/exonuclease/phosphatase family metal-dependent hydrolase
MHLPESKPLHVIGVYCPHIIQIRKRIHTILEQILQRHPTPNHTVILAGDFNATLQDADRHNNMAGPADHLHRSFIRRTQMQAVEPLPPQDTDHSRRYTFHKGKEELPYNRIDDIYINLTAQQVDAAQIRVRTRNAQDTSDHDMLIADITYESINLLPPLPPLPKPHRSEDAKEVGKCIRKPDKQAKLAIRQALAADHQATWTHSTCRPSPKHW